MPNRNKTRVYEVAKQLDITSKELIEKLYDLGVEIKNHMSTIEEKDLEIILGLYGKSIEEEVPAKKVAPQNKLKNKKCCSK